MGVLDNIRGRDRVIDRAVVEPSMQDTAVTSGAEVGNGPDAEKAGSGVTGQGYASGDDSSRLSLDERNEKDVILNGNEITSDAQLGVRKAEAAALVWSKRSVYLTYVWIWVCFFMLALQSAIQNNLYYNAYATFSTASQVSTANVLAAIIGGVLKLPIAKVLNVWGRAEGFAIFVGCYILGIIIMAACNGPNAYAAGYTLYWVGYDALYFIMDVFIADTSGLRNRAFAFAFASTPFICTAFTGPLAAQSFLSMTTWRWGIGAFAIIMVFVFAPLIVVFKFFQIKAEKMGLFVRQKSGRTAVQSIVHYVKEFDIMGAFLLMAAWVLILLPFSLCTNGKSEYKSATFIAMFIVGWFVLALFALWEKFGATTTFVRWELFKKRTVLGACCLAAVMNFSFYAWDQYYYTFVIVVYNLSVSKAGYMSQIYNVGSCFWGPVFGVFVRYTKHFKYACLCFGLPLLTLGAGLMIHFRGTDANIGYIVMCQIFIAFGGGTLVIGQSMAVMAAADRDGVPMMLALIYLFSSLGGGIGDAVSSAIYANTFVRGLDQRLPPEQMGNGTTIMNSGYLGMMEYPVGSPTRDAINYAWGYSQKYNCIAATAILALGYVAIFIWKDYNVDKKQNKGTII